MPLAPRFSPLAIASALIVCLVPPIAAQQDTTTRGVRLGISVTIGTKPGVLVLPVNGEDGDSIRAILQRDFDFSDRINVIATDSTMGLLGSDGARGQYNYPLYARLGAQVMLQATMAEAGLHVAAHNVAQQKVERVKDFPLDGKPQSPEWRLSLHAVADEIESWMNATGARGIAATRLLYADARGGRIWQIDSDGANPTVIAQSQIAVSPAWHPKATHLAYILRAPQGDWQIIVREIGGATRTLPTPGGSLTSPIFSPDGSTIIYAHGGESGVTNLYATSAISSESPRRITVGRIGASTSPTFSPDGRQIAFASDRTGHLDIYISDADGTNAELLLTGSYGDQLYRSDPDWSPDGRLIAFQSQIDGRFQIMSVGLRDRAPKRLTSEGINENASWSPDSRHIVFTSDRTGTRQLYILDVESSRIRQLTYAPAGARQAAWSPVLRGR